VTGRTSLVGYATTISKFVKGEDLLIQQGEAFTDNRTITIKRLLVFYRLY